MSSVATIESSIKNHHGMDISMLMTELREGKKITALIRDHKGERKSRLFISQEGQLCEFKTKSTRYGFMLDIDSIISVVTNCSMSTEQMRARLVEKYKRLAGKALFKNAFIEACLNGDPTRSLHENSITTGTRIDGKCITVGRLKKYMYPSEWKSMVDAINKHQPGFRSDKFNMDNFDCHVETYLSGQMQQFQCCLSVEYRGTCNGYYYLLVNEETFIGYDID